MSPIDNFKHDTHTNSSISIAEKEINFFDRFCKRIKETFSQTKDQSLEGRVRVQQIIDEAHLTLEHFHFATTDLDEKLNEKLENDELKTYVKNTMKLIHRDYVRIQKREFSEEAYASWMKKAKIWSSGRDLESVIMKQMVMDLDEQIDKDLSVITNYKSQFFSKLSVSVEEKQELQSHLDENLSKVFKAFRQLKESSKSLDFDRLVEWKKDQDRLREMLFNQALYAIDVIKY